MKKNLLQTLLLCVLASAAPTKAQPGGTPLAIHCAPDLVLLTCSNSAVGHFEATASGNDGPVVCVPPSGSEFALGVTNVICTATDINGGSTNCSFAISVEQPPSRWPCPAKELGLGIPFESVGGAVSVVRPGPGLGAPGISIIPNAANPESGIVLQPGAAQAITFTTVLDFTAAVGSGFELVLPPDPLHPNDPPILSMRSKGAKGYCVKTNKRFADDPTTTSRVIVVNSNGAVLPPLEFTAAEIDANGVFDIGFIPGVTNCHVTIEINCLDGGVSIEFSGPITQSSSRKGWDGCIYGPDRPVKKGTSRVMLIPPVTPDAPPITELRLRTSGWPEVVIEEPSTTSQGRKWGDGHVTLMKAYDDGEQGVEFVSLTPGGGVHVDLGHSTAFQMRFSHFNDPTAPPPEQTFRIGGGRWPIALTNRPTPPPIQVRLATGPAGVDCSADYTAYGVSNVTAQLWLGGFPVREKTGLPGHLGATFASVTGWPTILGCPGVGVVRLANADGAPLVVFWPDEGSLSFGDELRIIPELPPGEVMPATFAEVECVASDGLQGLLHALQATPATPLNPLSIVCPGNILTSATSPAGATVNYVPFQSVGECKAFPYPQVVCTPETGSVFPVGTTTVNCSVTNACGELATCSFNVTVDQRPVILTQPTNVTVTVGQAAQLNAAAYSGPTAFYRWEIFCPPTRPDFPFCGCLPLQTWRPLCLGCPPPFVDFPSVTAQCGSGYYLVVSNNFGVVTSAVATITVVPTLNCRDLVFLTCSNSAVGFYQVGVNGQQGTVVCTPSSGSTFPLGVTSVTCVATNYSGGMAECSFSVTVKQTPASWACNQVGIGIPFQPVGSATAFVRPEMDDRGPAIVISPNPANPQSGVLLSPGPAQAITFTMLLDFDSPPGSGFDIVLPPDPLHPNQPPILSMHRKSGPKGYCVKTSTKLYDDPSTEYRAFVVNTNGDLLDPLTFTSAEIEASGVFDLFAQPGASNSYVTVQVDLLDGTMSVEFPGPTVPSSLRKGWDGCIYGNGTPSKGTKGQHSRVIVKPYSPTYPPPPPILALYLYPSNSPTVTVEDPTITSSGRKWGDGHVTLMKAYDDGETGVEFRSFAPGGGVHVDLGHSESFNVRLEHFETGDIPTEDQLLTRTIGPIALTNRPTPPPFLDALLLKGPTNAVDCSADFSNLDSLTVRVQLFSNHVMVAQRSGVLGQLDHVLLTLPSWPETLSKVIGATPCRRGTFKPGTVRLPGGAGILQGVGDQFIGADEFRVLAELPPGAPLPDFYGALEFISNDGPTWRVSNLQRTLVCTPSPLSLVRGTDSITLSWSGVGFRLEGAETVGGPWFDLGVASPVTLSSSHAARFFRLVCD